MSPSFIEGLMRASFALAGVVHLLPLAGLLGRSALERAYGVDLGKGHDLEILMQHRALLFGILAVACLCAVVRPHWREPVAGAAMVSMLGFVVIAASHPHGIGIARVMWVDVGVSVLLAIALGLSRWPAEPSS
jgi:hypothetical protein